MVIKRFYAATRDAEDYTQAIYNFINQLDKIEDVRCLWAEEFSPDDSYFNHCFGSACWVRIKELEGLA